MSCPGDADLSVRAVSPDSAQRVTDHTLGLVEEIAEYLKVKPQTLDAWVARALAIRSDDRYPYVTTMWNDLIRIIMRGSTPSAHKAREKFGASLI